MIVRCPACQTAFRSDPTQLHSAGGLVRCGACLHVFRAEAVDADTEESTSGHSPVLDRPVADDTELEPEPEGMTWELVDEPIPVEDGEEDEEDWLAEDGERQVSLDLDFDEELLDKTAEDDPAPSSLSRQQLGAIHRLRDTLELPVAAWRRSSGTRAAGFALAALLVLTLALQYLWFNREPLAQQPSTRPWVQGMCRVLPCSLAPMRDLAAITSEELQIRSHPSIPEALVFNLRLSNQAGFEQPFPAIDLVFRDTEQQAVAARRLQPADYLESGLQDREGMPAGSSVELQLELADPGEEAINYEVMFLPAAGDSS